MIAKPIWTLIRATPPTSNLAGLAMMARSDSILHTEGWFDSFRANSPLDSQGRPLPWMTYGAIHFLADRVREDMSVFEYGAGSSTLWWAERVGQITSCEHDPDWCRRVFDITDRDGRVTILCEPLPPKGRYPEIVLEQGRRFHVVVVDGRYRVQCARNGFDALREDGIILWDNTDRARYQEGIAYLEAKGMKRIDFRGLAPGSTNASTTTIFYRPDNCLGI